MSTERSNNSLLSFVPDQPQDQPSQKIISYNDIDIIAKQILLSSQKLNFSILPNKIVIHIFTYLDAEDLCTMTLVNKQCNILSKLDQLWKSLIQKKFPNFLLSSNVNPKKEYYELSSKECQKNFENANFDNTIALPDLGSKITSYLFSPKDTFLALLSDNSVTIFNVHQYTKHNFFTRDEAKVKGVCFSHDEKILAVVWNKLKTESITIYNLSSNEIK